MPSIQKMTIEQLVKKLPLDFHKRCTRDISLLSCSVFGESNVINKKEFGVDLSAMFWNVRGALVDWYLSEEEEFDFHKKAGELCRKSLVRTKKMAKKLVEMTDWFDKFLKENKRLEDLVKNNKIFFDKYKKFFAYHWTINWSGDYLAQLSVPKRERKKVNFIVKTLDSAYKYNELVVPKVEKYFKKLKIGGLLYDEIDKNVYKNIKEKSKKARSLLFIKNQRIILSRKEARKIEKIIEERIKKAYQKLKEFRGLAASSGNFKGKVRRILDLDKLDQCQKNDVLVTTMTRPQFNKYIKQVGAIITDEGGMLCHASMLAREFKIPCIVGTKIATKVLKDGDLVEVDAGRGVVKILKK